MRIRFNIRDYELHNDRYASLVQMTVPVCILLNLNLFVPASLSSVYLKEKVQCGDYSPILFFVVDRRKNRFQSLPLNFLQQKDLKSRPPPRHVSHLRTHSHTPTYTSAYTYTRKHTLTYSSHIRTVYPVIQIHISMYDVVLTVHTPLSTHNTQSVYSKTPAHKYSAQCTYVQTFTNSTHAHKCIYTKLLQFSFANTQSWIYIVQSRLTKHGTVCRKEFQVIFIFRFSTHSTQNVY